MGCLLHYSLKFYNNVSFVGLTTLVTSVNLDCLIHYASVITSLSFEIKNGIAGSFFICLLITNLGQIRLLDTV